MPKPTKNLARLDKRIKAVPVVGHGLACKGQDLGRCIGHVEFVIGVQAEVVRDHGLPRFRSPPVADSGESLAILVQHGNPWGEVGHVVLIGEPDPFVFRRAVQYQSN